MSHLIRTVVFYQALVVAGTLLVGCSSTKTESCLARIDKGLAFGEQLVEIGKDQYVAFCKAAPTHKACRQNVHEPVVKALEHGPMLAGQIEALVNEIGDVVIELAPEHDDASSDTAPSTN